MALRVDKKTGRIIIPESSIESGCTQLLELDGWRTIKTDLKFLRGLGVQEKGMADRLYIRYNWAHGFKVVYRQSITETFWIEWKSIKGKPSSAQTLWHEAERKRGALTLIAGQDFPASIEGFTAWYRGSGLMRRKF